MSAVPPEPGRRATEVEMPKTEYESPEDVGAKLKPVMPPNWYAGPLSVDLSYVPIEGDPPITYSIEFRWGQPIEGGPVRHYMNGQNGGIQPSGRTLTVTAKGHSSDDLAAVARLLPSLEPLGLLPWPIEFDVTGWTT